MSDPEIDAGPPRIAACPTCDGDGIDASHDAALYYAHRGELSPCPTCDGTGSRPNTEPLFDSAAMNVWCEGCGEDAPLDPVEVEGRGVLMVCDRCYRELDAERSDPRFRVKIADPHTVREYVVTAASRDDAWMYVRDHADDLTPDRERVEGGVYWASPNA